MDFSDLDDFDTVAVKREGAPTTTYKCHHCNGTGSWSGGTNRYGNSKCIPCQGRGGFKTSPAFRAKTRATTAKRKATLKQQEIDANRALFNATHGEELATAIESFLAANTWSDFFGSLNHQLLSRGSLSENQVRRAVNGMAKAEDKLANKPKAELINASALQAKFAIPIAAGLKRPRLRVENLAFSLAPAHGVNAGWIYVKDHGDYMGKIGPDGEIVIYDKEIKEHVIRVVENLDAAIKAHGIKTGECGCCGRELTDPNSIEMGIGPVCAEKWGFA